MLRRSSDGSVWVRTGRLRRPCALRGQITRRQLGQWGEWVALKHLRRLGWDIVARNWKGRRGEVDLIGYDGPFLVFVEVKTRRLPGRFPPEENVDTRKERQLDRLAYEFLLRFELPNVPVRLDVIGVETTDLRDFRLRHYLG